MFYKWLHHLSYTRLIALSFLVVILSGALLLTLPFASSGGQWTDPLTTLFTATSATCVTGLVVVDTCTYWSFFGQLVILAMIQIGGIGFMTIIIMFFLFTKKKIGLQERMLLQQSAGNTRLSGIVLMARRILLITLACEGIGALLLAFRFVPKFGVLEGIYYSVFHSISAFCNAGFDLMGKFERFSSFTAYPLDPLINLTLAGLIITGGTGFLIWEDILKDRIHLSRYSLHAKIALSAYGILLASGTLGFFIFESNTVMTGYSIPERLLASFFMSTTTRTAGFNTLPLSDLSEAGSLLSMILMLIGGNPGSTAGGLKTSTVALFFLTLAAMAKGENEVTIFKRRFDASLVKQAAAILIVYLTAVLLSGMVICHIEGLGLTDVMFETVSAAATVGLSRGLTPGLGACSRIILIILMFFGRIGGLSLMMVFGEKKKEAPLKRPLEKILIG